MMQQFEQIFSEMNDHWCVIDKMRGVIVRWERQPVEGMPMYEAMPEPAADEPKHAARTKR